MMNKTQAVYFTDYERISDVLMTLDKDKTLTFNVSLAYKKSDGTRNHFHKEYIYASKYLDKNNVISIKRNFTYYLSITVKNDFNSSIMINQSNMIALKNKLQIVYNWFSTLYQYKDDKLVLIGSWERNELYLNQFSVIEFEPIICQYSDGKYKQGVRIYLNSDEVYTDLDIDRFMELYYIIDNMDMYQNAIILLNYISPKVYGNNIETLSIRNDSEPIYNNIKKSNNDFFKKSRK